MNVFTRLFCFLAGIKFTIILISSVVFFVIFGTLLESATESHSYASFFTYSNPLFIILLWGFFINILFSALRRWPFQVRHLPFLITHFGLLMILGGILIKSRYGLQGNMEILEGGYSQEVFIPDTMVIRLDKRPDNNINISSEYFPLERSWGKFNQMIASHDGLKIELAEYSPHSSERLETWIKGGLGYISGFPPFPIHDLSGLGPNDNIPISSQAKLNPIKGENWNIIAGITQNVEADTAKAFTQNLEVIIYQSLNKEIIYQGPFAKRITWEHGYADLSIDLEYSEMRGLLHPHLKAEIHHENKENLIAIDLDGNKSLKNQNLLTPYLGKAEFTLELRNSPSLVALQDYHHDTHLFAYDEFGRIYSQAYRNDNLNSYIAYDRGFEGYFVQTKIPFLKSQSLKEIDDHELDKLKKDLIAAIDLQATLPPPLEILKNSCKSAEVDFPSCLIKLLDDWNCVNCWLLPVDYQPNADIEKAACSINFNQVPSDIKKACYWTHVLFLDFEQDLKDGVRPLTILKQRKWPLIHQLQSQENDSILDDSTLSELTEQIFALGGQLPDTPAVDLSTAEKLRMLTAYLRVHNIHLSNLNLAESNNETIDLECPLTAFQNNDKPLDKLEDNLPKICLKCSKDRKNHKTILTYDRFAHGLKWPILNGEYLIRFQPNFINIPYQVRLRNARQINYANSTQPYSYECDLMFTDQNTHEEIAKTISMNNVHETWDGYRFYLSNIAPPNESAVKRVQLAVNYDPAKYWLTYPGAVILTIGVLLLFWWKR